MWNGELFNNEMQKKWNLVCLFINFNDLVL